MNDKWVEFAIRIQSIAQAGLQYGKDKCETLWYVADMTKRSGYPHS